MRNWRIITAAAAVVLAMLAAVLAYQYLNQADERAADKIEQVEAFVVAKPIPKGTSGATAVSEGLIETREVTKKDVPPSAITGDDQIADLVATSDLAEGQIIVAEMFQSVSAVSGFAGEIGDGQQAITIQVDAQRGVGGFIVPNDTVNIMVTAEVSLPESPEKGSAQVTAFLLPGIKVLAVGNTTVTSTPAEGEATQTDLGLLTLAVTPRQAEQIAHAQNGNGQIYLSLNAPGFDPEKFEIPAEIVAKYNWFDQPLTKLSEYLGKVQPAAG